MTNDNTTTENNLIECYECGDKKDRGNTRLAFGHYYCINCFDDKFRYCDGCGDLFYYADVNYCDAEGDYRCNNCYISGEENNYLNEIEIPFNIELSKDFDKNPFKNTCGIEIECLNSNLNNKQFEYNDLRKYGFNQLSDGSLDNGGVEFSSNAFNGDLFLNKVNAFCKELNNRKYKVNQSCGMHVHIKIIKTTDYLKKIFLFYSKFEDYFFNMLPQSRQNNHYCYRINMIYDAINKDFFNIDKMLDFEKKLYECQNYRRIRQLEEEKYNNKRYCWINFHSIFYRGTLEIRNHNGTIDANKINNWVLIHLNALDFIKNIPLDVIKNLPKDFNLFLSIFNPELRKYIIDRTLKFNPIAIKEDIKDNNIYDRMLIKCNENIRVN